MNADTLIDGLTKGYWFMTGWCIVVLVRNHITAMFRHRFLVEGALNDGRWAALPDYADMVLHPKHWRRWTFKQWDAYARRRVA